MSRSRPLTVGADVGTSLAGRTCRVGWSVAAVAGAIVVAVGGDWWSVAAAMTLGYAAVTDLFERRVPRWSVRIGGVAVGVLVVVESWRLGDWASVSRAGGVAAVVLVGVGGLWWCSPEMIGLGDVKAIALALGAAAAVSWRVATNVLLATALAGMAVAVGFAVVRGEVARRSGVDVRRREITVPFVPPLCVGFIVGVAAS